MADENRTLTIATAKDAAKELLSAAFNELEKRAKPEAGEEPRLFFPNGIELIFIKLEVSGVKVEFKVAGAKQIPGLLPSDEIE